MDNTKDIDDLFSNINSLADENHLRRNSLISKVMQAIEKTDFTPEKLRASELESRLGMISTVDSLMKSQEAVQINNLKLNLQKKSDDDDADHAGRVIELLQQIAPDMVQRPSEGNPVDLKAADDRISERMVEEKISVSEGEMEKVSTVE